MFPPIFEVCSTDFGVQTYLGSSPCRFYPFGEAPQRVELPYAVWQTISGAPENYLNQRPDIDRYTLQVDVYASNASEARDVAEALNFAIETYAHIIGWRGESRDPDTDHYRYSFDVDWMVKRTQGSNSS